MEPNSKNIEGEALGAEVSAMTGEAKTKALRMDGILEWLQRDVWPNVKPEFRGKPMTKEEMDALWE